MRRLVAIATGVTALLLAGPAFAFEQTPAAPPQTSNDAAPAAKAPAVELGAPAAAGEQSQTSSGAKVLGFGILPKLDFGLELLYGDKQQQQLQLEQGGLSDENDDLTVLGKINRHF
jgi:hypothetical protein